MRTVTMSALWAAVLVFSLQGQGTQPPQQQTQKQDPKQDAKTGRCQAGIDLPHDPGDDAWTVRRGSFENGGAGRNSGHFGSQDQCGRR